MVEALLDESLDMCEIGHHAGLVERGRGAMHGHYPVVAVEIGALACVGQIKAVRRRYLYAFRYIVHLAAKIQKNSHTATRPKMRTPITSPLIKVSGLYVKCEATSIGRQQRLPIIASFITKEIRNIPIGYYSPYRIAL